MMYVKYFMTVGMFSLSLVACSNLNQQISEHSPNKIYADAQQKLRNSNWKQAVTQLQMLDDRYPFLTYSQQVKLDLIYAYYKNSDLSLAQIAIDRFIRLNAAHPKIDYVIYMRGLINMAMDENVLQSFFSIDRSDCNPQHAYDAFNDFSKLIRSYPNSRYIADATKRLILLKNRLAKYEYSVAIYYARRGAWIAVVNRVSEMFCKYPDTQATRSGLKLMENAYRQMHMYDRANKIAKIIADYSKNA